MFCSKHYKEKFWTNHERESAQERALREHSEYILPAKFDDTEIPGLKTTIAYIDLRKKSPYEFCALICQKLGINILTQELLNKIINNKTQQIKDALSISDTGIQIYFSSNKNGMLYSEALHSIQRLQPVLEEYQIKYSYHLDRDLSKNQLANCIICIGGEYTNKATEKYLEYFPGKLEYLEKLVNDGQSAIIKITPRINDSVNPKCVFLIIGMNGFDRKSVASYFAKNFIFLIEERMRLPNDILYLLTQDEDNSIIDPFLN